MYWCWYWESNSGPHPYQGCALPTEPYQHNKKCSLIAALLKSWRNGRGSNPRPPAWQAGILTSWTTAPHNKKPGSDLLSHKRTLHYHRRGLISLLCSEREQVVLRRYCRRAKGLNLKQLRCKGKEYKLYFDFRWCSPGLYGQDIQTISIGRLHASQHFHFRPINVVVCNGLYELKVRDDSSWGLLPA